MVWKRITAGGVNYRLHHEKKTCVNIEATSHEISNEVKDLSGDRSCK